MSRDETFDAINKFMHAYLLQNYRHAAWCHGKANEALTPQERDRWMMRAKTIEELLDPIADAQQMMWRNHPEMRLKLPEELVPESLRKGPRLVVNNGQK